ncbi:MULTISPECIES: DHA2 family efflux MFS transporter permease subunit [unclassified Nocardiopsis]|uniref:DHA2 family efflux MFS transporter permease subunit n=1 Tax=Nocardiopsis TaxID=2013 RepID=UPI00387AD83F
MSENPPRTRDRERLDAPLVRLTAVLLAGAFAALADSTVVTVAVDDLSAAYDAPVSQVQWVVTANLLAMTAAIPAVGWALDRFGPRAAWIGALTLFGAGAALSCLAWSLESLIAMRALTGFGGGMVLPLTMAILARAAGPGRVGRAMALISVPGQLAPVLGPVAGGAVLASLGHRWVFALVLPLVAIAVLCAVRGVPRGEPDRAERLDPVGLALLSLGLVALLHGLSSSSSPSPGSSAGLLWAGLGALLLAGFVLRALRPREGAPPPALDLRLFAHAPFRNGAALMFVFGLCIWGGMFLLPLFHQRVAGADPLDAGLLLAPMGAGVALAVLCVGGPADRLAPRYLVAALATVPFALATADTPVWWLGAALFVRGAGLGTASVPLLAAAYRGLAPDRIPHATVALNVLQRVGAAAGTAGLALVLARGAAAAPDPGPAFQAAFWWMAALTAAALLPALLLPATRPDRDA